MTSATVTAERGASASAENGSPNTNENGRLARIKEAAAKKAKKAASIIREKIAIGNREEDILGDIAKKNFIQRAGEKVSGAFRRANEVRKFKRSLRKTDYVAGTADSSAPSGVSEVPTTDEKLQALHDAFDRPSASDALRNQNQPDTEVTDPVQEKNKSREFKAKLKQFVRRPLASGARGNREARAEKDDQPEVVWTDRMRDEFSRILAERGLISSPEFTQNQMQGDINSESTPQANVGETSVKSNAEEIDIDAIIAQAIDNDPRNSFLLSEKPENIRKVVQIVINTRAKSADLHPDEPPISDRKILALAISKIGGQTEDSGSVRDAAARYKATIIGALMAQKDSTKPGNLPF